MIYKQSGNVTYGIVGCGGFLGLGEDYHTVAWGKLRYDTAKNGFVTDITKHEFKGAPVGNHRHGSSVDPPSHPKRRAS